MIFKNVVCHAVVSVMFLCASQFASAEQKEQFPKWLEPTDEFVTPHIKWDKPSAQRPLRVLFITYRLGMREIVEICERFDIEREIFAVNLQDNFSGGTHVLVAKIFPGISESEQQKRLHEKLSMDYDCIVIGNIAWNTLPEWARTDILQKVASGTGLTAYISSGKQHGKYLQRRYKSLENLNKAYGTAYTSWDQVSTVDADDPLNAALAEKTDVDLQSIVGAFPFAGLPAFARHASTGDFAAATLDLARHGEGRIALLTGFDCTSYQMLTPAAMASAFNDWHMVHYDYYLALAGRTIRWAAKRRPAARIVAPEAVTRIDRSELSSVSFSVEADAAGAVELEFALRHGESGEIIASAKREALLEASANTVAFEVGLVPAGPYFADLWVRSDGRIIDFGSRFIEVTSKSSISEVVLVGRDFAPGDSIRNYSQADPITGTVKVAGAREGLAVNVSLRDNYERLTASRTYPLEGAAIEFELRPSKALSVLQQLDVQLLDGEEVLDHGRESFTYNDLFLPDDDVYYVLWQGMNGDTYLNAPHAKTMRDAGIDLWWNAEGNVLVPAMLRENMHKFSQLFGSWARDPSKATVLRYRETKPAPGGGYVRVPCISDPDYLRRIVDDRMGRIKASQRYSTRHYTMGAELTLAPIFGRPQREVCFGPESIRAFREYLKGEYGSIDRLNSEYGTDHSDFSDVAPIPFEKALETGQIPLWIDFRRHMDYAWANQFALIKEAAQKILPEVKIGFDGSSSAVRSPKLGGLGGEDYWRLGRSVTLSGQYFWPLQLACMRDFSDPGTFIGGSWGGGYPDLNRGGRTEDGVRWLAWSTFLQGANSFWIFQGSGGSGGSVVCATISPDFTWYDYMQEYHRTVKQLKSGIGKLVMAMDRADDGVAVLYSQASMLLANFTPEFPQRWDSLSSVTVILPESNFQYRMIASEQLEAGVLREGDIKLLYLPNCQALSEEEVEEIRAFVESGGSVVADLRPAVADEHGKPYATGALDDVFGIMQDTGKASPVTGTVVMSEGIGSFKDDLPATHADASVRLAGGKALAKVADAPAVVVNDFGQGKAALFNFAISDYILDKLMMGAKTSIRFMDEETSRRTASFVREVFGRSGLRPAVAIVPQTPVCHLYRFRSGEVQMMGLLQDFPPFLPGFKPAAKYPPSSHAMDVIEQIGQRTSEVTLQLDAERHIYDVLEGEYLGLMRDIPRTVQPSIPHLLAALPYMVKGVSLGADSSVKQGEKLSFSTKIETDGAPAGLHVIRVELTDPDGEVVNEYTQKLRADGGAGTGTVDLSLDEKAGDWKILARDIASGVVGTARFHVEAGR